MQAKLSDLKMKENWKPYFLAPYNIFKTSTNWGPSLHITDRAQILYTVFWYHKTTFETLTPCTFQKKSFSIHPTGHATRDAPTCPGWTFFNLHPPPRFKKLWTDFRFFFSENGRSCLVRCWKARKNQAIVWYLRKTWGDGKIAPPPSSRARVKV